MKLELPTRRDGRVSLTLSANQTDTIRIPDPNIMPYRPGSQREKAWCVVRLMDGLTISEGHRILELLEPGIQGVVGRPLGWIANAVTDEYVEIHR